MSDQSSIALMDGAQIEQIKAHCLQIAKSGLVPEHFAKTPSAIYTAIDMARALGEEPVTLMQNIYFVAGRAGFSSAYMLSRMRRRGVIRGTVRYDVEGSGQGLRVRAKAIDAETGEELIGPTVSMEMAAAEGWTKNAKYKSMPEVMLRKRAVTFLVREHYPDVLMGFLTSEELEDMHPRTIHVETASASDLNRELLTPGATVIDEDAAEREAILAEAGGEQ